MLCRNPYMQGMQAYPCGQCMPCRFNRRRTWTSRIVLESMQHTNNSFLTLTYSDKWLPSNGSLEPKHLQDWLKRFRKATAPSKLRFFAVGEYGDQSQRPHYHLALFNYPTCHWGNTRYIDREKTCCPACDVVKSTWSFGNSMLGQLELKSAQYIAGYVVKKLTNPSDQYLNGRHPEFARMSLKPGIGATAIPDVASVMLSFNLENAEGDVPSSLRSGKKLLPLGRYLRRLLRKQIGRDEKAIPNKQLQEKMHDLRLRARNDQTNPSVKFHLVKEGDQAVLNLTARNNIHKKRGSI